MPNFIKPNIINFTYKYLLVYMVMLCSILFSLSIYYSLFASPPDYQHGETVRIMYVHVPSAWMSLLVYSFMAACAVSCLVWKNPTAFLLAKSAAPIGALFTLLALITGMLWGKPGWGTFWEWDARLTSVLILFFLYLGFIILVQTLSDNSLRQAKTASILLVIGIINLPIIKFSVDWWNTLHQPASIITSDGIKIAKEMQIPLFLMFSSFFMYFLTILTIIAKINLLQSKRK